MKRTTLRAAALALVVSCFGLTRTLADGHGKHVAGAGVTSLDVFADGESLHLLSASRSHDGKVRMHHQRSDDHGATWSRPVVVGEGQAPPENAHRGMDVQVAAAGDRVLAVWSTTGTGAFGGGPMVAAFSDNGGRTWQPGPNPADDGSTEGHGFLDVAADAGGAFHLVWLDNRDGVQGLRYARSDDGGRSWSANLTLDPETCECCWNAIATGPGGSVAVLYRDKAPRDMAVVHSADGGRSWSRPARVGAFDWGIEGCPHVGGGIALVPGDGGPVGLSAIWTGDEANFGTYLARSAPGLASWGKPLMIGGPGSTRPDLAATSEGRLAVVWDARFEGRSAVFAALSDDGGATWSEPSRLSAAGASASHPRVVATPRGFLAFWTETADETPTAWASRPIGGR